MDSYEVNHPALVKLRAWESAGTSLELHVSGSPGSNIRIPVLLIDVSPSEVRFNWSFVSPTSSATPLVRAEGAVSLLLAGASLLPNNESSPPDMSPDAPVYIWRGANMCIIRPIGI